MTQHNVFRSQTVTKIIIVALLLVLFNSFVLREQFEQKSASAYNVRKNAPCIVDGVYCYLRFTQTYCCQQ